MVHPREGRTRSPSAEFYMRSPWPCVPTTRPTRHVQARGAQHNGGSMGKWSRRSPRTMGKFGGGSAGSRSDGDGTAACCCCWAAPPLGGGGGIWSSRCPSSSSKLCPGCCGQGGGRHTALTYQCLLPPNAAVPPRSRYIVPVGELRTPCCCPSPGAATGPPRRRPTRSRHSC